MLRRLRSYFSPAFNWLSTLQHRREETKKAVLFFSFLFLACACYHLLRNTKLAFLLPQQESGAEVLPFIKIWCVLPASMLVSPLLSHMFDHWNQRKIFYVILSSFLLFYTFFLISLPIHKHLYLDQFSHFLSLHLPSGARGLLVTIRYWPFSLFYITSELWSSVVLSVLCWGFANQAFSVSQARKFYSILSLGPTLGGIFVGCLMEGYSLYIPEKHLMACSLLTVLILGLTLVGMFYLSSHYLTHTKSLAISKSKKKNVPFHKHWSILRSSPYILLITLMVFFYGSLNHITETVWHFQLVKTYPKEHDYFQYLGYITRTTSIGATVFALFSFFLIRSASWTWVAMITPMVFGVMSFGMFGSMFFHMGYDPIFFGSLQVCFLKASKFTLFDPTKEIALMNLPSAMIMKGKTAADVLGSRSGKSAGALILQMAILLSGSLEEAIFYLFFFVSAGSFLWIFTTILLGKMISRKKGAEISVSDPSIPIATAK